MRADRLVQQHARPARAERDGHHTRRRRPRFEVHHRLAHRVAREPLQQLVGVERVAETPARALVPLLAAPGLLGDDGDRQMHQRTHVGGDRAVGARHEHHVVFAGEPPDDLLHARIGGARVPLERLEDLHLGAVVELRHGIDRRVERVPRAHDCGAGNCTSAVGGDRARHLRRGLECFGLDVVGVGERRLLARDHAHAHALVDRERARLHFPFLERPPFGAVVLEVEVGVVGAMSEDRPEHVARHGLVEPEGRKQRGFCNVQRCRFDLGHVQLLTVLWVSAGRLRRIFA